jgi:ABC-type sugar transport system ATPase subunit
MTTSTSTSPPLLEVRGVSKSFAGVRALDRVGLTCRSGRVHAVLGENGAGKSTLVRILTGNTAPDEGDISLAGSRMSFHDPRRALAAGITAVYQELTVLPDMSILDNVLLGQEKTRRGIVQRRQERRIAQDVLARVGLGSVNLDLPAGMLSLANQQLVEIARALVRDTRLLILDEPSAVLSGDKLQSLFGVVRSVADHGIGVIYISHRLEEVKELAADITIFRDGHTVSSGTVDEYDVPRIIREMVGRDVDTIFPPLPEAGSRVVLKVRGLLPEGGHDTDEAIDLDIRAGELVSVAGLVGSGRSRLLRTLAGAQPRRAGTVEVQDRRVGTSVRDAVRAGIVLVPEERKTDGLVLPLSVCANATLASLRDVTSFGWLSLRRERAAFKQEEQRLQIRASGPDQITSQLSGGNQQKIVLSKWLRTQPKVLLLDEPTRGIDVGAKNEIYRIIREQAGRGLAVLIVSSDLPEVTGLAHRVVVCRQGSLVGEFSGDQINEESIMNLALGVSETRT